MDQLKPEMLMDTGARYYGRHDQLLAEVRPAGQRLGQPGKNQFDQPVLDALLLDAARVRPRIELLFNTEAGESVQRGDRVHTTLTTGGKTRTIDAAWVVACDGGKSPMRTQLGVPLEGSTQLQKWIVVDILNSAIAPEKFAEFHCNGSRPVVIVPGVNGRRRYEFMLLPGESDEVVTTPEFIKPLVEPYETVETENIRRAAVYVAHQRIAVDYRVGRILLLGDAAHLMPPFAGQALNAGIRDAANVAWKLAANLNDGASESLLDTYALERRPHARDMVRLSHRIGKVVMSTNGFATALRDGLIYATGAIPPLKRWLTGMKFLKQPHYREGVLLAPHASVGAVASEFVGRTLPQPDVELSSGTTTQLDNVLGNEWAIVRCGANGQREIVQLESTGAAVTPAARVSDATALFAGIAEGISLIVRPDRYVAAAVPTSKESAALSQLALWVPDLPARYAAHS